MSYILDALRRADSERERGAIPGIHAQPVPPHWRDARRGRRTRPWVGALIGVSVVVLGAFAWHMAGREAPQNVAPSPEPAAPPPAIAARPAAPAAPAPATAAQNPPAAAVPAAVAVAPKPPAATTPAAPATKMAERPRSPTPPPAVPARRKAPPAAEPATVSEPAAPLAAARAGAAAPAAAKPAPAPAASPPDARVHALAELPPEIRRQLPALAIGGSMYSESASSRMLIVNGQLVHEGDTLGPGLSLEQIKLKSAVLRFKGYRYEINY